jgi:hypothetical protein
LEEPVGTDDAGRFGTLRTWISARRRS